MSSRQKQHFVTNGAELVTIGEPNWDVPRINDGGSPPHTNANSGAKTHKTKSRNLERIAQDWSQFNTLGVSQLDIFKSKNTQATSLTKEVNLASTRHTEAHELLMRVCCNRKTRSVVNGLL